MELAKGLTNFLFKCEPELEGSVGILRELVDETLVVIYSRQLEEPWQQMESFHV